MAKIAKGVPSYSTTKIKMELEEEEHPGR